VADAFGEALVLLVQWQGGANEPVAVFDGKTMPISMIFELVAGRAFRDGVPRSMLELLQTYAGRDPERKKDIAPLAILRSYETASRCLLTWVVGSGEGPVMASDGDAVQSWLGSVVRHAQAAIVEEAGERGPATEAVLDGFGDFVAGGELAALLAQPSLQRADERPAAPTLVLHRAQIFGVDRVSDDIRPDRCRRSLRLVSGTAGNGHFGTRTRQRCGRA
jgi:hypothetical protein